MKNIEILKEEWKKEERKTGGGLVFCLEKYDKAFTEVLLEKVTILYNRGLGVDELAEIFNRPEMEILIALLHQSDQGEYVRPYAYRGKRK